MRIHLAAYCAAEGRTELLRQWDAARNTPLTPETMVWWQCPDGHVWKAAVHARAGPMKTGCPMCAGRTKSAYVKRCFAS